MSHSSDQKVLLLDVDGVLVTPCWLFRDYLIQKYGLEPETTAPFFGGEFLECVTGKKDLLECLPPWLEQWNYPGNAQDFLVEWLEAENSPNHELIALIHRLKHLGWQVYLATIQEKYRLNYLLRVMQFGDFCDGEFSSFSVGYYKPQLEYFQTVSSYFPEARVVFWDDSAENIEAAKTIGWEAYRYTYLEDFRKQMF